MFLWIFFLYIFCLSVLSSCYKQREFYMKHIKTLLFVSIFSPCVSYAAANDFMTAAQLLSAAKNADIMQVQSLINAGADVNFVDSTGLSIVCTALMNNDMRAAQILQMYGADASKCDQQIRQYNSKQPKTGNGGLFSGLTSAHGITLAAAGAGAVVGGLLLLTDVFDSDGGGGSESSQGNRPGTGEGGSGGGTGGTSTVAFTLPYGPQLATAELENSEFNDRQDAFSSANNEIFKSVFDAMNIYGGRIVNDKITGGQNYLLMMHGYAPLARGYLGMRTLRNDSYAPLNLSGNQLGPDAAMGGLPVNVALVTDNGIGNIAGTSLENQFLIWTTTNNGNTTVNGASNDMISAKYYNDRIVRGDDDESIYEDTVIEDASLLSVFDLSGFGTAINNSYASASDNVVAQVVGGGTSVENNLMGFMPNGQMSIFRTGGGTGLVALGDDDVAANGNFVMGTDGRLTSLTLGGVTFTDITYSGNIFTAVNGTTTHTGYIGADGNLYVDGAADGIINMAYQLSENGTMVQNKKLVTIDYQNYAAMYNALEKMSTTNDTVRLGRTAPSIIANTSVLESLHDDGAATINTTFAATQGAMQKKFTDLVTQHYNQNTTDGPTGTDYDPATDAVNFFTRLGLRSYDTSPLVVFSTGAYDTGNASYIGDSHIASFENAAPLVFSNLEHKFMSVVAVGMTGAGTTGTSAVSGFNPAGKYALAQWKSDNGTSENTSDDKYYQARICGVAGTGVVGDVDPWCFAAAGVTDELATAAAAGEAGVVASAFDYMNTQEIFTLLALTADGAYLATDDDGKAFSEEGLITHLQSLYTLPSDYQYLYTSGEKSYLDAFKEVFGYGLINLERATKPGTSIYYYDGKNIVSASGNAYWRAASNTAFRSSAAFNPRMATISAPFFDVLTSVDGTMSMPRVWKNEFSLGSDSRRALYMGDTLAELHTRPVTPDTVSVGNIELSLTTSERAYNDVFGGLDNMNIRFTSGNWELNAGYSHYNTDGESRFNGFANPIMSLATNAVNTSAEYKHGNWTLGMHAMSGYITDEGLLENDPTISAQYAPAHLGQIMGGGADFAWSNDKFHMNFGMGVANETNTILGAYTDGLLSMGAGRTTYFDGLVGYDFSDAVSMRLRGTIARTTADASGDFILGLTDVWSDSVAFGTDIGNFGFSISRPLAITRGAMQYAHAEYDVVGADNGKYELAINDIHVADVSLRPENRELRFMGTYRHNFGEFTDGAVGFIYRVNPNNTDAFGNESIFMMKMTHRLGI